MEVGAKKLVFVAGATGGTGIQIINVLLEKNHNVRALVRDIERAKTVFKPNESLELVVGNTNDIESLKRNLKNVDGIICTTGARALWFGSDTSYHVDFIGVSNLVDAAKSEKVDNFVLVSSTSVTKSYINIFGRFGHWKVQGENHLKQSKLRYMVVRPAGLTNDLTTPKLEFGQGDHMSFRSISRRSVAEVCEKSLSLLWKENAPKNITFEVSNDRTNPTSENDWNTIFTSLKPDN